MENRKHDSEYAADFDIGLETGFLPTEEPIQRLTVDVSEAWDAVETCLEQGQRHNLSLNGAAVGRGAKEWRTMVEQVLSRIN